MPLPTPKTPREREEVVPAALSALTHSQKRLGAALLGAFSAVGKDVAHGPDGRFTSGGGGASEGAMAATTRAAVASATARVPLAGGLFSKPGVSRGARERAAAAHDEAASAHAAEGSHDWARYHQGQAAEERRAAGHATRKDEEGVEDAEKATGPVGAADLMQGGLLAPDQSLDRGRRTMLKRTAVLAELYGGTAKDWDESQHPRGPGGQFGAGGAGSSAGGGKPAGRAEVGLWRAAGGVAKLKAALGLVLSKAFDKAKAAPAALKHAVMHEVGLVKSAAQGLKAAATGEKMSDEQKKALRTVAVKVAVKLAFAAAGAALPGVGHAVGHAIEHIAPHVIEKLVHHVAHHAAEHAIEHAVKHAASRAAGVSFKADADGAQWLVERVYEGLQDAVENMSDADWSAVLSDDDGGDDPPGGKSTAKDAGTPGGGDAVASVPGKPRRVGAVDVQEDRPVGYEVAAKGADGAVVKEVDFQGIPVHVDRPAGYVQKGTAPDGTPWERTYKLDYGFIPGTKGGDGAGLDVFLGRDPDAPDAHWAVQVDKDGEFDEYKVLFGFGDQEAAKAAYLDHVPERYLKCMKSTSVQMVRALIGLEPVEVVKALLADTWEDALGADLFARAGPVEKAGERDERGRWMVTGANSAGKEAGAAGAKAGLAGAAPTPAYDPGDGPHNPRLAQYVAELAVSRREAPAAARAASTSAGAASAAAERADTPAAHAAASKAHEAARVAHAAAAHVMSYEDGRPQFGHELPKGVYAEHTDAANDHARARDNHDRAGVVLSERTRKADGEVDKASVVVAEHERRAPLSGEAPPTKGAAPKAAPAGPSGVSVLREAARVSDAGSALHAVGNVLQGALAGHLAAAQARARGSSAAAGKLAEARRGREEGAAKEKEFVDAAQGEAKAHAQACADHYDAARRAEDRGDAAAADHHDAAAAGHAEASNRIAAAVDAARAKQPGAVKDLKGALDAGAEHAASVAPASGAPEGGGHPHGPDGKFTGKASVAKAQRAREAALASVLTLVRKGAEYTGALPLPSELQDHPALTADPTETYPVPDEVGGWLYVIDGAAAGEQNWIAFVDTDGKALLWTRRDVNGGVVGVPYLFRRDDLVQPNVAGQHPLRGWTPVPGEPSVKATPEDVCHKCLATMTKVADGADTRWNCPGCGSSYTDTPATRVNIDKAGRYTVTLETSGVGYDCIKRLLANLEKHGGGGHSFGIVADDTTTGAAVVPKSGELIVLGGWDGDGGAYAKVVGNSVDKARPVDLSNDSMARPLVPVTPAAEVGADGARKGVSVELVAKADDAALPDERYVLGVVLKPEVVDSQGDIYSADEVKKTAHKWMKDFRNLDLQHKVLINGLACPVESYVATQDLAFGKRVVPKGSWLLAGYIADDDLWSQVKAGDYTGWSISGLAKRTPLTGPAAA